MMNFWRWFRKNDARFTAVFNFVCVMILLFSIGLFAMNKADPTGGVILEKVGYQPIYVQTGSMEPTIKTKAIILAKRLDDKSQLEVDDIILYQVYDEIGNVITITHRIYNIKEDGRIITKGDNNRVADSYTISEDNVKAEIVKIWNGAADIQNALTTPAGIISAIVIVAIIVAVIFIFKYLARYLDEKYGVVDDIYDTVNDQLRYDNEVVEEDGQMVLTDRGREARGEDEPRFGPKLLDTERSSWQKIYNYSVSHDNKITITGVKPNFLTLSELTVPRMINHKRVIGIGQFAFKNCVATIIHLPDTLEFIDRAAFYQCENLIYVEIPNTVTRIGANAFDGCKALMEMRLPVHLTKIEDKTFNCCINLDTITLNEKITSIGDSAFNGCYRLTSIYGGKNVQIVKLNAFKVRGQGLLGTTVITDNEVLNGLNWNEFGRNAAVVNDRNLLALVDEENQKLYESYDEKIAELAAEVEEEFGTKLEKKAVVIGAKFGEFKEKAKKKLSELDERVEAEKKTKKDKKKSKKSEVEVKVVDMGEIPTEMESLEAEDIVIDVNVDGYPADYDYVNEETIESVVEIMTEQDDSDDFE